MSITFNLSDIMVITDPQLKDIGTKRGIELWRVKVYYQSFLLLQFINYKYFIYILKKKKLKKKKKHFCSERKKK